MLIYLNKGIKDYLTSEYDAEPTRTYRSYRIQERLYGVKREELRLVLLKALNKNQILILSNINGLGYITPLLSSLSQEYGIPLSTLKFNAKILQNLRVIAFSNSETRLTNLGKLILEILNDEKYGTTKK